MTPERIIRRLSRRYGVSEDFGRRLRPLLLRALESPPDARRRILELVERSYVHQAQLDLEEASARLPRDEAQALRAVARILHGWIPPEWLEDWGTAPEPWEPWEPGADAGDSGDEGPPEPL